MANPVNVVSPQGELVSIDQADLAQALQEGFKQASAQDLQHYEDSQTYDNPLLAGAAGAARGATLGLSDQALVHSKLVEPKTLKGLLEHNPKASMAGEVAGIVAPALIGHEAGVIGAVSKLGRAAEREAAEIVGKTGAKALGSSVEGAAYGLGSVVTEQALGDPDLTAQSALAQVGITGLLTGALGGTLGLMSRDASKGILDAKKAILSVDDVAKGTKEALNEPKWLERAYAKASSVVSGKPEESILKALSERHMAALSKEEKAAIATDFSKALGEQHKSLEKALGDSFKEVRKFESEALLRDAVPEKIVAELGKVKSAMDDVIIKMEQQPELYPAHFAKKLEAFREGLERDTVDATKDGVFKALNQLKQNLDTKIKFGKIPASNELDAIADIKALRSTLKMSLQSEEAFGKAGARQGAFNNATHEYLIAKEEFQKKFMTKYKAKGGGVAYKVDPVKVNTFLNQIADPRGQSKAAIMEEYNKASRLMLDQIEESYKAVPERVFDRGAIEGLMEKNAGTTASAMAQAESEANMKAIASLGGSVGEGIALGLSASNPIVAPFVGAYNALRNPSLTVQRLAVLEKNAQKVNDFIKKGVRGLSEPTKEPRAKVISMADARAKYRKETDKLKEMMVNPEKLMDDMTAAVEGINEHAPTVAQSMTAAAAAGLSFLLSKLPEVPDQGPFQSEWEPSPTEVSRFNRYYDVIENPLIVLKHAKEGSLTPEHVEAISTVYPKLYNKIQEELLSHIVNAPNKKLPYRSQLMVSMLLGQNLVPSLAPSSIVANQMTLNKPMGQPTQPPKAPSSRNNPSKLDLSNRSLTPLQSTIVRTR